MSSYILVALFLVPLSYSVTIRYKHQDITSKSKTELFPMLVTCQLNDIVIIAAPILNTKAQYHLHKPNNDVIILDLPHNTTADKSTSELMLKYINSQVKSIVPMVNRRVIHTGANSIEELNDVVGYVSSKIKSNEFIIGPLMEEDHGNWILSVYFKDVDDNWMELFQVITIEIIEGVQLEVIRPEDEDDTLYLSFAYPIKGLTTCELTAPDTTYDRFYDRSKIDINKCGYVIHNLTKTDEGQWKLIGIGKVVYEGTIHIIAEDDGLIVSNDDVNLK